MVVSPVESRCLLFPLFHFLAVLPENCLHAGDVKWLIRMAAHEHKQQAKEGIEESGIGSEEKFMIPIPSFETEVFPDFGRPLCLQKLKIILHIRLGRCRPSIGVKARWAKTAIDHKLHFSHLPTSILRIIRRARRGRQVNDRDSFVALLLRRRRRRSDGAAAPWSRTG